MKRASIFLMVVTLIAGMVGCRGESYALAITSTTGGNVTVPGEGAFAYEEGTVVNLMAEAEEGYRFTGWTGDVSTISNVTSTTTNITMEDSYFITANFVAIVYSLTITSTAGGNVTAPGEGEFAYDAGTVVNLLTETEESHSFMEWVGDVGTIADVYAASTTVTMNGDYSITASFIPDGAELVWDWYDLDNIRNNLDGYYILMNDLDYTTPGYEELASPAANGGQGWDPIGTYDDRFAGTFDGRGYQICDLSINRITECVGLFSRVTKQGMLEDIHMPNFTVAGYRYIGGLVGENHGTVSNCDSGGSATGDRYIGGLVGINTVDGTITNCYATGTISGGEGMRYVGGLVGQNGGMVTNCYATATVSGDRYVGTLIGYSFGYVGNCYAAGNATGNERIGGLVGITGDSSIVSDCYATCSVTGGYDGAGGLVGANYGTVSDCHSDGNLTGGSNVGGLVGENADNAVVSDSYSAATVIGSNHVGGLVGWNTWSTVTNCYAVGTVDGVSGVGGLVGVNDYGIVDKSYSTGSVAGDEDVGGLVGYNYEGTINNCYAMGEVGGSSYIGGLVGRIWGSVHESYSTGVVSGEEFVGGLCGGGSISGSNLFWDTETSGQDYSHGGTGKNTTEMKDFTTFLGATWDIVGVANPGTRNPSYIWNIVDNETYPFLSWQPVS